MTDALFVCIVVLYVAVTVWTFLFFAKDTDGLWMIPIRFVVGVLWPVVWFIALFMGVGFAIMKVVKDAKDEKPTQT